MPRTFLGSVLLAWLSDPVIRLAHYAGFVTDKFDLQIIGSSDALDFATVIYLSSCSPASPRCTQYHWILSHEACHLPPIWRSHKRALRPLDLHPISFTVLDGTNTTQYVRFISWCASWFPLSLRIILKRMRPSQPWIIYARESCTAINAAISIKYT